MLEEVIFNENNGDLKKNIKLFLHTQSKHNGFKKI